jgi:type II secretory pathway pseudopilin PulG
MTIIETTVVLAVLFVLAGAMSPIIGDSVTTARAVKAKNDASMIAMALINLQKDLGSNALIFTAPATLTPSPSTGLPELLTSGGDTPSIEETLDSRNLLLDALTSPVQGRAEASGPRSGRAERRKWREARAAAMDDLILTNRRGYKYRKPGEFEGWNGPYISAPVQGDPWGKQFMINSEWLDGGTTAADAEGHPRRAVFVMSAGADGIVQTPFEQPINDAAPGGDDIVVRIQ